jgi:5-methylcytosine-specific restriction enzyme subunit McrC
MFGEVLEKNKLSIGDIDQAERALNRLSANCAPALTLIRLLLNMQGASLQPTESVATAPGFLFDMNYFFQRLLSR